MAEESKEQKDLGLSLLFFIWLGIISAIYLSAGVGMLTEPGYGFLLFSIVLGFAAWRGYKGTIRAAKDAMKAQEESKSSCQKES